MAFLPSIRATTPALRPSDTGADAMALNQSGSDKYAKGDLDGAIADYNRAIQINPQLAKAYYNRGLAKKAVGDMQGAIGDFSQAHALDPKFTIP